MSLAAEPVRAAVRSFVRLVALNPGVPVRLTFLTTASIATEHQVAHRTGDIPGLRRWSEAADGGDVDRLREVLLRLDLGEEVHCFVRDRDDAALRRDLLQRIEWRCGEADTAELEEILGERVAEFCLRELGVPPLEGAQRADNVVQQVLRTCIRRTDRVLTHGGLRVVLRRATDASVDRRTLDALLTAAAAAHRPSGIRRATGWSAEAATPLPPLVVERPALTAPLTEAVASGGIALLHGGTGMGKTAAARLAARSIGGAWNLVELRGAEPDDAADRLLSYAARPRDGAVGVVVDDLPDMRLASAVPRLVAALREILERGEAVIATSTNAPTPRLSAALGLRPGGVVPMPALSVEEVRGVVDCAGGDAAWAGPVHIASRGGHPQLANAIVTGLRERGWPTAECDTTVLAAQPEVGAEAEAARLRLAAALPNAGARELLYRASLVEGRFPRGVALALGEVEPCVSLPGEAFDALVGPWVDHVAPDRFRVSPLLVGSGGAVLPPGMVRELHRSVADALASGEGLQADQADNLYVHGLAARAEGPLLALSVAIVQAGEADLWMLRPFVPTLAAANTRLPIAPWRPALSVQLRLAQALVLSARGVNGRAAAAVRALLAEIRGFSVSDDGRARLEAVALGKLMFRDGLSRHMPEWPDMLGRLMEAMDEIGFVGSPPDAGLGTGDLPAVLFAFSLSGLRDVARLVDAFGRLSALPTRTRARMLALDRRATAPLVVALAPWLKERKSGRADGRAAAVAYASLARLAASWKERDWAVAFEAAAANIRAEFNDAPGALRGLEAARAVLGEDRWLRRAEQKVRFGLREDEAVVGIVEALGDAFADLPIEAAHLAREGAIAASRLGRHDLAACWLEGAAAAAASARLPQMQAMAAGLVADGAAEAWRSGDRVKALRAMAAALDRLADLDPDADVQSGAAHRIVRHSLLWFAREAGMGAVDVDGRPPALPPGACSHPEPNKTIVELPLTPLDLARSFLFQIAVRAGLADAVPDPAGRRTGLPILSMEIADRRARLDAAIAAAAPDAFAALLRPAVDAALAARDLMRSGVDDPWQRAEVPASDPAHPDAAAYASSAILAFRVRAGAGGKPEAAARVRDLLLGAGFLPAGVLESAFPLGPLPRVGARQPEHCAGLVGRGDLGTGELLECCVRLLMRFQRSDFRHVVEAPLARWAKLEWRRFVGERRFALSDARLSAPAIQAAAAAVADDFRGLAALAAAAASGADLKLPGGYAAWLREVARAPGPRAELPEDSGPGQRSGGP
ncbi:hypothetical protein [Falsiroseomonas sp.]|uniref:hypothetical protein n=1 Tax=Falsiroseomonas sp. TaxID=2870721 RepID=UPI003F724709